MICNSRRTYPPCSFKCKAATPSRLASQPVGPVLDGSGLDSLDPTLLLLKIAACGQTHRPTATIWMPGSCLLLDEPCLLSSAASP